MVTLDLIKEISLKIGNSSPKNIQLEEYNTEYEGMTFMINRHSFRSRLAKKTPKKKGYFVVFWTKDDKGKNTPFKYQESMDKMIVTIVDNEKKGQFIFPKEILLKQGILSSDFSNGKMAIRVYPSWEIDLNDTALKAQKWQLEYFTDMSQKIVIRDVQLLYYQ